MSPLHDLDPSSALPPDWRYHKIRAAHLPSPRCSSAINAAPFPSHNIKPGRRRHLGLHRYTTPLRTSTWLFLVLVVLATLCGISEAGTIEEDIYLESRGYADPNGYEELLFDRRPQPAPPGELNLWRRQNTGGDLFGSSSSDSGPSSTTAADSSTSAAASRTAFASTTASPISSATKSTRATSSLMSAGPASTTLPKPFDTSLSSNFTSSSCPDFFSSFLNNATFQQCLPLSLLLQVSFRLIFLPVASAVL